MQKALRRLVRQVDIPMEIMTGDPVVELKGRQEAVVIRHRGLCLLSDTEVRVATSRGTVRLFGSDLRLGQINRERICVLGCLDRVELGGQRP